MRAYFRVSMLTQGGMIVSNDSNLVSNSMHPVLAVLLILKLIFCYPGAQRFSRSLDQRIQRTERVCPAFRLFVSPSVVSDKNSGSRVIF